MFYETRKNDHGLPHDPFKAIVAPRPIGWITSMSAKGEINLAPYSFFNAVSDSPPMVMFSSEGCKDSLAFIEETKEFVCNLATSICSTPWSRPASPIRAASMRWSRPDSSRRPRGWCGRRASRPRPARSNASSCRSSTSTISTASPRIAMWRSGRWSASTSTTASSRTAALDTAAMRPIARCGYADYAVVDKVIPVVRPQTPANAKTKVQAAE